MTSQSTSLSSWFILLGVGTLFFLVNIDYTAVTLALRPISEETHADLNTLQWLLSGYALIWSAVVVPAGRLADMYGKKRTLMIGLVVFMAGSILTGMGHDLSVLIGGRILQGLGAALFSAPAFGLVFVSFSQEKQGIALGLLAACASLGLAAGPTMAGWMITHLGWRWLFYINIPLGMVVIGILALFAAYEPKSEQKHSLDWPAIGLLALGLCVFMFGLNQLESWGLKDFRFWGLLALGCTILGGFYVRNKKASFQTLPIRFVKNKVFMSVLGASMLVGYSFALVLVLVTLYLQNTLGFSSTETGLIFLALTLVNGIIAPFGGKLVDHYNPRFIVMGGVSLVFISLMLISQFETTTSLIYVMVALTICGAGLGISFPSLNVCLFRTIPAEDMNVGSSLFTMAILFGNTLSVILSTSFLVLFGHHQFDVLLREGHITLLPEQHHQAVEMLAQVEYMIKDPELLRIVIQSFLHGFASNMLIGLVLSGLALGVVWKWLRVPKAVSGTPVPPSEFMI